MSLSIQILDLYDDLGGTQLKDLVSTAPSFMKTAEVATKDVASKLPTESFALHALTKEGSRLKKYPMHTPADTWLSCAYFEKNAHKLPRQAARIAATHLKVACEKFNLDTKECISKLASNENPISNLYVEETDGLRKVASQAIIEPRPSEGSYALPGMYPLFHEGHIKKATSYFEEHHRAFSTSDKHEFASNVLARAAELNISTEDHTFAPLKKVAGDQYGDRVEAQINLRRKIVDGDVEATISLEKVAMAKDKLEANKFAELLSAWDIENSMNNVYGKSIVDPYESTFDSITKESGYLWEDSTSGESLTGKELEKAASSKYDTIKGYFGETLANSLKKHGSEIFESLPSDAKTLIARIAKGTL